MKINKINNKITFGAKIGNIPVMKNVTQRAVALSDVNLKGYTAFIGADVYTPQGKIEQQDLLFHNKKLVAINDFCESKIQGLINYVLCKGKTIAPGILDEHTHGGFGVSFHNSSESEIRKGLKYLAGKGIGGVLATTLPGSVEEIKHQIKVLNNIIKNPEDNATKIFGIHLEGPFMNPEKKGIHPIEKLLVPTIETYEQFEPENVKKITYAPELDKGYNLSAYLKKQGVIPSAGHSMATAEQIRDSGVEHITHLFNAMAPFDYRHETITNEGWFNPDITVELIADITSPHVTPRVMANVMHTKPKDKLLLVSDSLPQTGIKSDFDMNGVRIHVGEDWSARSISNPNIIAGNMRFLPDVVKTLIQEVNITFEDFIRYASDNPSNNLGVSDKFKIQEGLEPLFSVWDNSTTTVEKTFV